MRGLGADACYWERLSQGELALPRCGGCGQWKWPAPFRCGDCGSWDIGWEAVAMTGTIYSWTRTYHPFDGVEELGLPYVTVSVELPHAGGIRLFGLLEQQDRAAIGLPVAGHVANTHIFDRDIPAIRWSAVS